MNLQDVRNIWQTAKDHGLGWTVRRVLYEAQLRSGYHKRMLPKRKWEDIDMTKWLKPGYRPEKFFERWKDTNPTFFFSGKDKAAYAEAILKVNPNLKAELSDVNITKLRYFSKLNYQVSYPNIWFTNVFLDPDVQVSADKHWSEYPMYSSEYEDLKFIWEPGRFAIVYDLVRAYFLTNDESLPEQYWQMIESWIENNPPNTGPHWKCGQETSLRLMAWYFGFFAFMDAEATTSERFINFLTAVTLQADRVSKDWKYSFIQQSNHAVSEGLGLYITGMLFPQLRKAKSWVEKGKVILEDRALFLFRKDGTYFQKSHNYLRFIIHAYLYILAFAEANEDEFSEQLKSRLSAAVDYLTAVVDPESGFVPNFGSNDGALIFPLNTCDFRDYRPTLAAANYYINGTHLFENGPWHEDLVWLFGPKAIVKEVEKIEMPSNSRRFDISGIYTLRSSASWLFMHAESLKDRPAHADALHVDLWWKGLNICVDPGTYLYYGHKPWKDALKHTRFHNTISIDDKDQMERTYRFTWGYWHDCQLNHFESEGATKVLEVSHNGFERLPDPVIHKRCVIALEGDYWIVIDDIIGKATHKVQLNWLLKDFPYESDDKHIKLDTPKGVFELGIFSDESGLEDFSINRGEDQMVPEGWVANYYGYKEPGIYLSYFQETALPLRIISCLGPKGWTFSSNYIENKLILHTPDSTFELRLKETGKDKIYDSVIVN